jgi:formylglycine-generating enzyme required for sulfatase activity
MSNTPELEPLITALRLKGFTVGVSEVVRLRQVFKLMPASSAIDSETNTQQRIKSLLRAVVVKERERIAEFDRIVDEYLQALVLPVEQKHSPKPTLKPSPDPAIKQPQTSKPTHKRKTNHWLLMLPLLMALLVLPKNRHTLPETPSPNTTQTVASKPTPIEPRPTLPTAVKLIPKISFTPPQARWRGYTETALALTALLALVALRVALHRRKQFPEAEPLPSHVGPPRVWLKRAITGPVLLNPAEQTELVWGVDRYIAETPTRQLDIPATVRASAKVGGIPIPCFQRARHARALWLWLDESAQDTHLSRLVAELSTLLPAHGLPLEVARFWGAPFTLTGALGERFAPREIEEQRDTAWVAILTDGKEIARQDRQDDQRSKLNALLRGLSHWPKLWFVDASVGATGLPVILAPHGLACLPPEQLARRIASDKPRHCVQHNPDEHLWEAACALSPAPVETGMAWSLRSRLDLKVSPWALRHWQSRAAGPAGHLLWPVPQRAKLINGLWMAEIGNMSEHRVPFGRDGTIPSPNGGGLRSNAVELTPPPHGGRLGGGRSKSSEATDFTRPHPTTESGSSPTPTIFNRALSFWQAIYKEENQRREEQDRADWTHSPAHQHWRMEFALLQLWYEPEIAIPELYRLFQGSLKPVIPEQLAQYAPSPPIPLPQAGEGRNKPLSPEGRGVGERGFINQDESHHILLPWTWNQRTGLEQKMLQAMGFAGGMNFSAVNLRPPARQWLGLALLLGLLLGAGLAALLKPPVLPNGEPEITHGPGKPIKFEQTMEPLADGQWKLSITHGEAHAEQQLPDAALVRVDWIAQAAEAKPGPVCTEQEIKTKPECMAFQPIPAGDFTMGSPNTDKNAISWEKPTHVVNVPKFAMGRYEVTNAQFHRFDPSHPEDDDRPAARVEWQQAKDFCQHYGYRLPTEAEWEYAARADSKTRYPFGDDPSPLKEYAWCSDSGKSHTQPVGGLKPNAWGLYDMLGNVLEWVEDAWHYDYTGAPTDGGAWQADQAGGTKVLRGGSWNRSAKYCRSAYRFSYQPGPQYNDLGFRCARVQE